MIVHDSLWIEIEKTLDIKEKVKGKISQRIVMQILLCKRPAFTCKGWKLKKKAECLTRAREHTSGTSSQ